MVERLDPQHQVLSELALIGSRLGISDRHTAIARALRRPVRVYYPTGEV